MGTQLLRAVEALGMGGTLARLSHTARLILCGMALNAHDTGTSDGPARTYFRGWEHLALAWLGYATYDAAAEQAVRRGIRELTDAGLVKAKGRRHGLQHSPVMYELTI